MQPFQEAIRHKYILDTSSLILLFEKCRFRTQLLAFSKLNQLYVPERVKQEYFCGENTANDSEDFDKIFIQLKFQPESTLLPFFHGDSTSGEIWVISYAIKNTDCICVIDEDFGSYICDLFGLRNTGSIGLLEEVNKQKLLSKEDLLKSRSIIGTCGFYLSKKAFEELDRICENAV